MEKKMYCISCKHFLGMGDWNLCCDLPHEGNPCGFLCYAHTPTCEKYEPIDKLTEEEFLKKFCYKCGSQRCEGIGTDWFDGCQYKDFLKKEGDSWLEKKC